MASVATSHRMPARRVVRSVELTRRQIAGIVLIACVPLPLLSLATTVVPLPQLVERAAARFIPFVPATLEDERTRVVRAAPARARPADRPSRQPAAAVSRLQVAPPTRASAATRTPVKRTAEPAPRESAQPESAPPEPASSEPASSEPAPREPAGGTSTASDEIPAPTPTSVGSAEPEPAAPTKKKAKEKATPPAQASENGGGSEKTKGQGAVASEPAPESPGTQSAAQSAAESPGRSGESNGGGNEDKPGGSGRP
jgi:hypothetical protein